MNTRTFSAGTALATLSIIGSLLPATFAQASSKGRKNTAIGVGAAAAYELLKGKTTNGVLLGAGAAYAYKKYQDEKKTEKRNQRVSNRYGGASTGAGIFTGRLSADTDYVRRQIKVDANGRERRVDVPKDVPVYIEGGVSSVHDLKKGDWVRVTAVPTGDNRFQASRIDVVDAYGVNDRAGAVNSYSGVGIVQGVGDDGRTFDIQVGNNIRRINAEDARFSGFRSVRELRTGDRVRIQGDLDGKDVFASQISLID